MLGNHADQSLLIPYENRDWGRLVLDRTADLADLVRLRHSLAPPDFFSVAVRGAPARCVAALRRLVAARGWHQRGARVSFDVLRTDPILSRLHPAQREWVRLALFGPRGEGMMHDNKHRQQVYDRACASILRETSDIDSLQAAAARVLNDPEVRSDPSLDGMLRSFVASREADFRNADRARVKSWQPRGAARPAGVHNPVPVDLELERRRVQKAATRLHLRLEEALAHYDVGAARHAVDELKRLNKLHPDILKQGEIYGSEARVAQLMDRLPAFRAQLQSLSEDGAAAAATGDERRAQWIARRLSALHEMLPEVLPTNAYERMRDQVLQGVTDFENQLVQREIIQEERCVITEIKRLAGMVHRFYKIEKRVEPSSPVYQQAERAYREAVAEIFEHDREWLASLMMKLDALLEDLDDPGGEAGAQVDGFLEKVRVALVRLRKEIAAHDGRELPQD